MAKSSTSCAGPSTGSKPLSSSQLLLDAINTTAGTTDMGYNMMAASLYFGSDATMSTSYGGYSGSRLLTPSDSQSAEDAHTAAYGNLNISSCDGYAQSENLGSSFQSFNLESSPQLGTQSTSSRVSLGDGCESRSDPEDLQYLQNFIDDMAGLMNAFDGARHAERFIPHRAMRCPPLLSALLAYGASFVSRETAHRHYDAATQRIKSEKEGSTVSRVIDSDKLADLAMAAVVLYIYETTRSTLERTSVHTSEARDLIQQGQWDGSSPGLGGACFWLFVATEVMISLERNWQVTWKPDTWAVDMNMTFIGEESWNVDGGSDEIWVHRIFFIMAKISDFRATASEFDVNDLRQMLGERLPQWRQLEKLCQKWSGACPLTMRPYAYIDRGAPGIKSRFPLIRFVYTFARYEPHLHAMTLY